MAGEFVRQMNTRIGDVEDPLLRLLVLVGDGPGGEIVLSCNHIVCDGRFEVSIAPAVA